ncbi:MAG TPA: hypothetical protein VMB82_01775, partial [Acidimicrobiales bacterium]|nr:hypothetical protein [Acidimicrobiales bacterium]
LRKATSLVSGLVIHRERALDTLTRGSLGLVFSQAVLLALVDGGLARDDAYRVVQRDARQAFEEGRHLREVLADDPEVSLSDEALDQAFDLDRYLRHRHRFLDALQSIDRGEAQ